MALVTITGVIRAPGSAGPLQYGRVRFVLSQPATAIDGRVVSEAVAQLDPVTGAFPAGFQLDSNDGLVPAGTYYKATVYGQTALGTPYSGPEEKLQLAGSPASIDYSAVPRRDVVAGAALGVVYPDVILDGGAPSSVYGGTTPDDMGGV